MNRAGNKLFACSVFSGNQNTCRSATDFLDSIHECTHHRRIADDFVRRPAESAKPRILFAEIDVVEDIPKHHENAIGVEWLLENLVGASCVASTAVRIVA